MNKHFEFSEFNLDVTFSLIANYFLFKKLMIKPTISSGFSS